MSSIGFTGQEASLVVLVLATVFYNTPWPMMCVCLVLCLGLALSPFPLPVPLPSRLPVLFRLPLHLRIAVERNKHGGVFVTLESGASPAQVELECKNHALNRKILVLEAENKKLRASNFEEPLYDNPVMMRAAHAPDHSLHTVSSLPPPRVRSYDEFISRPRPDSTAPLHDPQETCSDEQVLVEVCFPEQRNAQDSYPLEAAIIPEQWVFFKEDWDNVNRVSQLMSREDASTSCALHAAAFFGFTSIAERLLKRDFNPNAIDQSGRDYNLHLSCFSGIRSFAQVTPLQLAKEQGHEDMVKLLERNGATECYVSAYVEEAAHYIRKMISGSSFFGVNDHDRRISCPIPYISHGEWIVKGEFIGKGCFGEVYHASLKAEAWLSSKSVSRSETTRIPVCVKVMEIPGELYARQALWRELAMSLLSFTRQRYAVRDPLHMGYSIDGSRLSILMRKRDCTLQRFIFGNNADGIHGFGPLATGTVCQLAFDLADQLHHVFHARGFVHADLKLDNVLVSRHSCTQETRVSIDVEFSDFGLARMTESNFRSLFCVRIAAPELKQTGKPTEKSDVFALGILLWECLKRAEVNSSSQNGSELFRAGLADAVRTASGDEQLTALLRCIEDCVSPDPNVRPTAFDISERMKAVGAVQKAPTAFTASPLVAWDFHREMWLSKRRLPEADTDAQMNSMPDRRRRGDPDERDVRSVEPARHWSPADRL